MAKRGQYGANKTTPKRGAGRAAQPGSVKPRMSKLYDGLNVATRPIPIINDYGDQLAAAAAAADQRPKGYAVNMPSGPRPTGAAAVLGTKVSGAAKVRGGVFNPVTGLGEHT